MRLRWVACTWLLGPGGQGEHKSQGLSGTVALGSQLGFEMCPAGNEAGCETREKKRLRHGSFQG
jgi:hypothetical protein